MYEARMIRQSSIRPGMAARITLRAPSKLEVQEAIEDLQAIDTGAFDWELEGEIMYEPDTCRIASCSNEPLGSGDLCYTHVSTCRR